MESDPCFLLMPENVSDPWLSTEYLGKPERKKANTCRKSQKFFPLQRMVENLPIVSVPHKHGSGPAEPG